MLKEVTIRDAKGELRTVKVLAVVGGEEPALAQWVSWGMQGVLSEFRSSNGDRAEHVRDVTHDDQQEGGR